MPNLKRVLIANRGEIAVRIIRTLRELGIESVAIFSDADRESLHVKLADYSVAIGGTLPADSYLRIDKICDAIKATKSDGVHPGFGFLSESAVFAQAVADAGAEFIGPTPAAMVSMGDKIQARETMKKCGVPVVPGSVHPLKSLAELHGLAKEIGLPVILKATAGGGGRGMRVIRQEAELDDAFAACTREAQAYFGNPAVFCERYVDNPRHIEFQVLFDKHGNGVHLFERDCSIQRRHQKLLEEAPSAFLNAVQRKTMGEIAVRAGKAVGYVGAGTIEFICETPDRFFFMEMNTRIQVEHPVTEAITGIDLIAEMIRVAEGKPLPFKQEDIKLNGWAVETRINAENPLSGFLPQPGLVRKLHFPMGPNVRVDSHLYAGYEIPSAYDSMVAKIITWGPDRASALKRMLRALSELQVDGVPTTARFHEALIKHPLFQKADFTTSFIEKHWAEFMAAMDHQDHSIDAHLLEDSTMVGAILAAIVAESKQTAVTADGNSSGRSAWEQKSRFESVSRS